MRWGSLRSWLGESSSWPERTWSRASPSTTPSSTAPMPFSTGHDPGVCLPELCRLGPVVSGLSGPGPKESHEALTLAQELSHPFSLAFALVCCYAPSVPPGGAGRPRAGRGSHYPLDRAGVCRSGWRGELSCGAGRWPSRDREKKGLRRYARAWPPCGPQEQSVSGRIILPCWPRRMGKQGRQKKD